MLVTDECHRCHRKLRTVTVIRDLSQTQLFYGQINAKSSDGDNDEKPEEQPEGPKVTVADFYEKGDWSGLFEFIDVNSDGSLSWQEFLNVDGINNCTDLMAKVTTFRDADTDGDDKVTKEEFIKHMSELKL